MYCICSKADQLINLWGLGVGSKVLDLPVNAPVILEAWVTNRPWLGVVYPSRKAYVRYMYRICQTSCTARHPNQSQLTLETMNLLMLLHKSEDHKQHVTHEYRRWRTDEELVVGISCGIAACHLKQREPGKQISGQITAPLWSYVLVLDLIVMVCV
ncbi:hypothetical protein J6590_024136 [Homalodisca vitripennis]|nr:hypothetical protein J6590_024136 [Homalodisca vitripennis]